MRRTLALVLLIAAALMITACSPGEEQAIDQDDDGNNEAVMQDNSVKVDTDDDGDMDVEVTQEDDVTEVTLDIDEVEVQGEWCVPGTTWTYDSEEGSIDAEVLGKEMYKGGEFCKAEATHAISTPQGDINTDTTYYFDNDFNEYWIITTVNSAMMPEPQVTEVHLVDGEVQ